VRLSMFEFPDTLMREREGWRLLEKGCAGVLGLARVGWGREGAAS